MFNINHPIEKPRQMVAETLALLFSIGASGSAVSKPFAVRETIFHLVPVIILLLAPKYRCYLRILYLRYSVEIVFYLFLFVIQLPLIVKMLPFASTAKPEVLADRFYTFVRFFYYIDNLSVKTVRFFLKNLNINDVARSTKWNEHHFLFRFCDAHPFRAGINNFNIVNKLRLFYFFHGAKLQNILLTLQKIYTI